MEVVERLKRVVSYSELQAVKVVVGALGARDSGIIVASKLADEFKITRSVIVNGLKLLEAAGVVETRSLGMKGTFIKILDRVVVNELICSTI
ncbi:MAG TPA: HTH domain-containing protein [Epulopiscium sp.]|nr:HTH domain-containing protein [Candidatus Epulonipiscium sp.]